MTENNAPQAEGTIALEELIDDHLSRLSAKLASSYEIEDIQAQVAALNDILHSFRLRDEMLEKLIDITTPEDRHNQIRKVLAAQRMKVSQDREQVKQQHERSHRLIQESVALIARAQHEIDKIAHRHSGYAVEVCGLCKGVAGSSGHPCPPCEGKGTVLVRQPPIKCPRCKGEGRPTPGDRVAHGASVCLICRGAGWVMVEFE